jgi:hypothetical protein
MRRTMHMKTTFHTVAEIVERKIETPIDLAVIPNHMGINLCSVEGMTWTKRPDGQLVSLTIHFLPDDEGEHQAPLRRGPKP